MTVPTIIFLPLVLWPVCWMVVRICEIDSKRKTFTERLFEHRDKPTWRSEQWGPDHPDYDEMGQ